MHCGDVKIVGRFDLNISKQFYYNQHIKFVGFITLTIKLLTQPLSRL